MLMETKSKEEVGTGCPGGYWTQQITFSTKESSHDHMFGCNYGMLGQLSSSQFSEKTETREATNKHIKCTEVR